MHRIGTLALLMLGTIIGLSLAIPAQAQTGVATLTWVNPTQHVDNTPLAAGELTGSLIEWSQCVGTAPAYTMGTITGSATVGPGITTYTNTTLSTSWTIPHCFTVKATASATVTDPNTGLPVVQNTVSDPSSPPVWKLTLALQPIPVSPKPLAPSSVVVK